MPRSRQPPNPNPNPNPTDQILRTPQQPFSVSPLIKPAFLSFRLSVFLLLSTSCKPCAVSHPICLFPPQLLSVSPLVSVSPFNPKPRTVQAKVAAAGDANQTQSAEAVERISELCQERDAIQLLLDEATAQVRCSLRERPARKGSERDRGREQEKDAGPSSSCSTPPLLRSVPGNTGVPRS